jgi:hypothetical protein
MVESTSRNSAASKLHQAGVAEPIVQKWAGTEATHDSRVHARQELRFFYGHCGHYWHLALYIFCGEFLLYARLRSSNVKNFIPFIYARGILDKEFSPPKMDSVIILVKVGRWLRRA